MAPERQRAMGMSSSSSSSSWRLLLLFMVTLVVAIGFVGLMGLTKSPSWMFVSSNPYWLWRSSSNSSQIDSSTTAQTSPGSSPRDSILQDGNKNVTRTLPFLNQIDDDHIPASTSKKKFAASHLEKVEAGLAQARASIKIASNDNPIQDPDYVPNGPIYLNAKAFHRSYLEMEKQFKVFIYEEGEPPIFHYGTCKSTYAIEGLFIQGMEVSKFRTRDPDKAHVYFLPFSVTMITQVVYVKDSHEWGPMKNTAKDYVDVVAVKHRYWNRSSGADHFMLACHDWGPEISFAVPNLYNNSIRALCNANTSEKFNPIRDVSIPEILLPLGTTKGMLGGPPPSERSILVFYAGGVHGPIRPILLEHWEDKDPDVQVHKYLPKGVKYYDMIKKSKFCICPSGYEVASPRTVEGLYMGCVPVLIKDGFVAPFSDVLDWKKFSVIIPVEDIPNLKKILMGISDEEYVRMVEMGKQVRRHFEVNSPPKRYDVFHMILHSIWLRRLNIRVRDDK